MKAITEYMQTHELSQRQFADVLEVDKSLISRVLSGERDPSLDLLIRISKKTGHTLDELVKQMQRRRKQ